MDEFDSIHCHPDIKISGHNKTITMDSSAAQTRTCYGKLVFSPKNKTIKYILRVNSCLHYVYIGIDDAKAINVDKAFCNRTKTTNYGINGELAHMNGAHTTKVSGLKYTTGDVINMEITESNMTMYKNEEYTKFEIDPHTDYRLAVSLWYEGNGVTIMDSSMISHEKEEKKNENYENLNEENKKLKAEISSLQNALNDKINENERFKQIIAEQKEQKHEENQVNKEKEMDIKHVLKVLKQRSKEFKIDYNQQKAQEISKKNPQILMDENSEFISNINLYDQYIESLINDSKIFKKYIFELKSFIDGLIKLDPSKFREWNLEEMILWILSLENGRFVNCMDKLKGGFIKSEINKGEYLIELQRVDLTNPPFNIESFPITRDLIKHFQSLKNQQNDNQNEGHQTAYI